MARVIGLAALPLLIVMLSGCAGSPPVHFYQLSPEATAGAVGSATVGTELRIAVGPISLPEVVDRPQLVVRSGPNQVTLIYTLSLHDALPISFAHVYINVCK